MTKAVAAGFADDDVPVPQVIKQEVASNGIELVVSYYDNGKGNGNGQYIVTVSRANKAIKSSFVDASTPFSGDVPKEDVESIFNLVDSLDTELRKELVAASRGHGHPTLGNH